MVSFIFCNPQSLRDSSLEREPKRLAAVLQKARCYSGLLLKGGGIFARK